MKRTVLFGGTTAIALAMSGAAYAQSSSGASGTKSQSGANTITVTGCLQPAESMGGTTGTSGSGTSGTSGTSSSSARSGGSDKFMLSNASMSSATGSRTPGATSGATSGGSTAGTSTGSSAGTSGTSSGTSGSAMPGMNSSAGASYMLEGQASELRGHVNHQVQITGRLDASSSSPHSGAGSTGSAAGGTSTGGTTSGTSGAAGTSKSNMADAHQTLHVESVRMIASSCSGK